MEAIGLVVCTTGARPQQLNRCVNSHRFSAEKAGVELAERLYVDRHPVKGDLGHLVEVRNKAVGFCEERWALFCDDDDFVLPNHIPVLLAARAKWPNATVILGQCQDSLGHPLGFTLACGLVNIDRFRMVNWLNPSGGGEDFFTLSTLEVRGHLVIHEPTITWQVTDDCPSLTREERVELRR